MFDDVQQVIPVRVSGAFYENIVKAIGFKKRKYTKRKTSTHVMYRMLPI